MKYTEKQPGAATATDTQDQNLPINPTHSEDVTRQLTVRAIDRSPKSIGTLRSAHIAAESVYYPNSSRLLDVFEDVLLDRDLLGIIRKRISQVVNKKLLCRRGGKPVESMAKIMRSKAFKDIMRQIVWTKMWGINGIEFVPGESLGFNLIPKKHIKRKTQKITYEQTDLTEGIDYTSLSNVMVLGDPHDLGLLLVCGYIALLKKDVIADWAQYIQMFGSPILVLRYRGFDQSAKVAADNILNNIKNAARVTIPEEMGLTFEDGKMANGDGKLQDTFRQAANEEMRILILGNTETTGHSGTGTGAKSKVHSEQQLEIIKDDMDDILEVLNSKQFIDILKSYGLDVDGVEFEFDAEVDIAYLKEFIPLIVSLGTQLGLPVSKKYLYEITCMPAPETEDDAIQLFPTLGQPATTNEPDQEDGQPPAKPKPTTKPRKSTAKTTALSLEAKTEIAAIVAESFKTFFAQAL